MHCCGIFSMHEQPWEKAVMHKGQLDLPHAYISQHFVQLCTASNTKWMDYCMLKMLFSFIHQ